jgi:mono/diheme cytochrome c family protein
MQGMGISGGFVSGHRFSDAIRSSKSTVPSEARPRSRSSIVVVLLALLFSTYALADGGTVTYKEHCSACHGARGAGDTMIGENLQMRALGSDEVQNKSDDELAIIISKGKDKMPAFNRKLSKGQIADVVKYIRSLKK